jgi:hypothetical protein
MSTSCSETPVVLCARSENRPATWTSSSVSLSRSAGTLALRKLAAAIGRSVGSAAAVDGAAVACASRSLSPFGAVSACAAHPSDKTIAAIR